VRLTTAFPATGLSTLFPEVRLKQFLEMRGADGGPWRRICALPAWWVGLLYDDAALEAAWSLVKSWTAEERQQLRDTVPRTGLSTPFRKTSVHEIARQVTKISRDGLSARARLNDGGFDETQYLEPVEETVASGLTPAEMLLGKYHGGWQGDVDRIFREFVY